MMTLEMMGALRTSVITAASGAGGNTYCNIRPAEGEVWRIIAATCLHDDAALTMNIGMADTVGSTLAPMYSEAAVGAGGALVQLYDKLKVAGPIVANRDCYPYVYFAAMAAAKTITVRVVYQRIAGVANWNGA